MFLSTTFVLAVQRALSKGRNRALNVLPSIHRVIWCDGNKHGRMRCIHKLQSCLFVQLVKHRERRFVKRPDTRPRLEFSRSEHLQDGNKLASLALEKDSFIFTPSFRLGRVAGAAALEILEIPHGQQHL